MAEPLKKLFTRGEYHAMAEAGILKPEDRVELVEGEIYRMGAIGNRHAGCVNRLVDELAPLIAARRAVLSPQNPLNLTDISEPQPDVVLLQRREDRYSESHPTPGDVLLLIEVADSSIGFDRGTKFPLYARCGIPEAWLVDLVNRTLEVHRNPGREGYRQVQRLRAGDRITPLAFPDFKVAVESILP
jgi:Uma2 family endonuclease